MRHIEELKKEKKQLQRELKQSDQQSEIGRLTAEIQQRDEQLKELLSALSSMRRSETVCVVFFGICWRCILSLFV